MRVYLRSVLLGSLGLSMSACVTQVVTTPTQLAMQTTQTTGQAVQAAIPDGDDKKELSSSTSQSRASSYAVKAVDANAVKKRGRSTSQ